MSRTRDQNKVPNNYSSSEPTQMTLSHCHEIENTPHDIFKSLTKFCADMNNIRQKFSTFEEAEQAIRKLVGELEQSLVQETLSQFDINTPVIKYAGKLYHQVLRKEKTYTCAAGLISVERSLYRANPGEQSICPLEIQAGIMEDYWTPSAARLGCYVTAQLSPYQGEKLFQEFGRLQPSKSALTRLSTQLGETWDAEHTQFEQILCDDIVLPEDAVTVSASLDGIMLPLNKKMVNGYALAELDNNSTEEEQQIHQEKKAKAFYREAGCAAISFYDSEGERLKTLRFGRMPEEGKKTLKSRLQQSINTIVAQRPDINVVKIADGAKDNWQYLSNTLLPGKGTEILDYYHASEHLNNAFAAAYGKGNAKAIAHHKKYRSLLKNEIDGIEKVINTLRYLSNQFPKNETLKTELAYFRNNRHKMHYAQAIESHYPIGSGVTEAACKTLITQRMKCAGMRWDISGGQGVLTARSLIQSEQFDKGWGMLSGKYIGEITLPDNIIPFRT